jgi:hypothetical protein
VVCGPCWAAHGGKPTAAEIGPEPTETAPLRYPSGQRHWTSALRGADWVQDIRVDGQRNLLDICKVLARHANWSTLESWPGWGPLQAKTGLSETTIQRWIQELKLRGWIVVIETGSTPLTRPMGLLDREGNRRAVYALRIPLSPDEALRWAAETITAQAAQEAAEPATKVLAIQDDLSDQGKPGSLGDKKERPTESFSYEKKTRVSSYAREDVVVDNLGTTMADPKGGNHQTDALRARSNERSEPNWAVTVPPSSGFQMLVAADWLRRRLPIFARLTRKAVRAACRPYWRAGWSNLDIVHAMDHLPSTFGPRAGTPIGRGPAKGLNRTGVWWWIKTRLDAWRTPDDGKIHPGYYQTRSRRQAMRRAVATRYGRAGLAVLRDEDLAADPVLTPERIATFGRRIATQLRPEPTAFLSRPIAPASPAASEQARAEATERVTAMLAERHARSAAERHAAMMARYGPELAAARAELAARTGANPAATTVPVDLAAQAEHDALTPEERYERARALAAGYPRDRRRGSHRWTLR